MSIFSDVSRIKSDCDALLAKDAGELAVLKAISDKLDAVNANLAAGNQVLQQLANLEAAGNVLLQRMAATLDKIAKELAPGEAVGIEIQPSTPTEH